ncbi:hypothetical protein LguiA_023465 [Lonicera macranthoides]
MSKSIMSGDKARQRGDRKRATTEKAAEGKCGSVKRGSVVVDGGERRAVAADGERERGGRRRLESLTFKKPDNVKYPSMGLAYATGRAESTMTE